MTGIVDTHTQKKSIQSYPDTPVNLAESHLSEAIERAFQILGDDSQKIIKMLPKGITITTAFFDEIEKVWDQFVKDNDLPDVLIEFKDDFLYEHLDNGAGSYLFWDYEHSK